MPTLEVRDLNGLVLTTRDYTDEAIDPIRNNSSLIASTWEKRFGCPVQLAITYEANTMSTEIL